MNAGYQGLTHSDVDVSSLVWRVANKVCELKFQTKLTNRNVPMLKPITDLWNVGWQKFKSTSLSMFDKRIQDLRAEHPVEGETDGIATPNFQITTMDNGD